MTEQPDTDAVTWVTAADYGRIVASLDGPGVPNGRIRREAQQMRQERIAAGFDIARALGTPEGRDVVQQSGFRDGDTIAVDSELGKRLAATWARIEPTFE